jgi:polysaccharide export outer membrane protein
MVKDCHSKNPAVVAGIILAVMLTGCGGKRGGDIAYNPEQFGAPDAVPLPTLTTDYRLGAGDVLTVRVFKVDSLSGDQTIDAAGRINMAVLGYVPAAGRTTAQMEEDLTHRLGAKYLNDPKVSVTLKTAVAKTVTVDGSVEQPGIYPIQGRATLIRTIAMARGTADGANPKRVVVFRQIGGRRMAAAFDLTTIRKGLDPDPMIYADDVIVVDGSKTSEAFKTMVQSLPFVSIFRPF